MKLTIETLDKVQHVATVLPIDMVRFERQFKTSLGELGDHPKMEHLLFLAHSALHRVGDAPKDFEAWMETVGDIEPEAAADAAPLDKPAS